MTREIHQGWTQGSVLLGPPDMLDDTSVRLLQNARLDQTRFTISVRPGMTRASASALGGVVTALAKRYAATGNTVYAQWGTTLVRWNDALTTPTVLSSVLGATPFTAAGMVDGKGNVWLYVANGTVAGKDNGTNFRTAGIAAPSNPPSAVALATDLTTTIDAMDAAASWTGASLSAGPANEANIKQEGANSITFTIAANTWGSIGIGGLGGGTGYLDLDTLAGGDATVKADDYIFLWVRCDRPDRVVSLLIEFDLDTQTLANAFRTNYYSARLPGLTRLNQGANAWTKVQVRKSEFTRVGTSTAVDWSRVKSARISALTSFDGAVQFYVDDFKLRGGTDIEGEVEYTVAYRSSTSGGRGNPPLSATSAVRYTTALTVDRQRVSITTTNVRSGGADHPSDAQIDTLILYRRINEGYSVNIAEFADSTASPYVDSTSVAATALNEVLEDTPDFPGSEAENDLPPAADVVFGPGALNRLFYLVAPNRCYVSKAWQRNENRAENVPPLSFLAIGSGSEQTVAGIVSDTTPLVWTDQRTYKLIGTGDETFVPLPIPNSRPCVGRYAVDEGDGRIFFMAPDGLYEQIGDTQVRVVDVGETLSHAAIGIDSSAAGLALTRVQWHSDTHQPSVVLTISSLTPPVHKRLVIKRNLTTGHYTDVAVDTTGTWYITPLLAEDATNRLYGGGSDGYIYRLEDSSIATDAGTAIAFLAETKSHHQQAPHLSKGYSETIVEGHTHGEALSVTALFDKQTIEEPLGTMTTTSLAGQGYFPMSDALALHHDLGLRIAGNVTTAVTITRYGWYVLLHPEAVTFWDSGVLLLPHAEHVKGFRVWIDAPTAVTMQPSYNGEPAPLITIPSTVGRQLRLVWCPRGVKAHTLRVTLTATASTPFRPYELLRIAKPLGSVMGYQERSLRVLHGGSTP